jgi:hypothetical protein
LQLNRLDALLNAVSSALICPLPFARDNGDCIGVLLN